METGRARFAVAVPVWPAGREREMNLLVGFRTLVSGDEAAPAVLRVTACNVYRATVNGEVVGYGPARAAHGWFRVDEWEVTPYLRPGRNVVALEVACYNVCSYYHLNQPAFLQAEVVQGGEVAAATGRLEGGFEAAVLPYRAQKAARYSFQRAFTEVYHLGPGSLRWRQETEFSFADPAPLAVQPPAKGLLARGVPRPDLAIRQAVSDVASGRFRALDPAPVPWRGRYLSEIGPLFNGFPESELAENPAVEVQAFGFIPDDTPAVRSLPSALRAGEYRVFDLGVNLTGFIRLSLSCAEPTHLLVAFDELLTNGDVSTTRLGCANVITLHLQPGVYEFESFEPYTLRYLKLLAPAGTCEVRGVEMRTYAASVVDGAAFACSDARLERLFQAGRETYRQNAVDVFTDCPSRERAAWLCDSFFTARAALDLTGDTAAERVFLENFLLPDSFPDTPAGMLPMCYPADHPDGVFIPNWAMWLVLQLQEYLGRSNDRELVERFRPRVLALLDFLEEYRNELGLLEKLPSWVFIEWSAANDFVQDVNYPTNMLYARTLEAVARLYQAPELCQEAERLREIVRERSFDGEFFVDNAVRTPDGRLVETKNRTEVCQYYAFFFGIASPTSHRPLWRRLVGEFGPRRIERGLYPDVHPANSFIGNMLRVEMLSGIGGAQQILDESVDYLMYMVERTGTLWENVDAGASCNHGFASHICHTLYRDLLGVSIDRPARGLLLHVPEVTARWCSGTIPVPGGMVSVKWERKGDHATYAVAAPKGYTVRAVERTGLTLERVAS